MNSTTSHRDCTHPATKAGRAKCRKARAAQEASRNAFAVEIRDAYEAGTDIDELIGMISLLGPIDPNLDIEEIIASL